MAASDKPFRDQHTLDIVYAVSCILMLLSIMWMFWQDYNREYKTEQRLFRQVEVAMAQRTALELIPSADDFKKDLEKVEKLRADKNKEENKKILADARTKMSELQPKKESAEAEFQAIKAQVESIASFRNIALELQDGDAAKKYGKELDDLNAKLAEAQDKRDAVTSEMKLEQLKVEKIDDEFNKALVKFKKLNDRFDTQVKTAINKQWGWADAIRALPVIDGFASPVKIHQFTINDIPIDYNFKQVTRFDRCMSCHVGIDRPSYTRDNLKKLLDPDAHQDKLATAKELYAKRMEALKGLPEAKLVPNPDNIDLRVLSKDVLTDARITEFCAHPRQELFVGSNSKHPAEKFGCTSCHAGQGSGTSFLDASHTPNSSTTRDDWQHKKGWQPDHMWDFPMLPSRFIESSCIKCHHEVTDLISTNNRNEAPKLLQGHSLIKENGCFGCHEISGWKGAARVGPDLRLEPSPPLEDLISIERNRAENDPDNRPGTMRKVGPALTRVSEKVHSDWIAKWLRSPSGFRPDTKMPHYYGLSNNREDLLPDEQKKFPNTEIASIAYFINKTSEDYLNQARELRKKDPPNAQHQDEKQLLELLDKGQLKPEEKDKLDEIKLRIQLRKEAELVDLAPGYKGDLANGRLLFTEKGCLACHVHKSTESAQGADGKTPALPKITSEALFGPNLTQLAGKFGTSPKDTEQARKWLIQWIVNPQFHSPRSRMPVTHLTAQQAADVAEWLLAQDSETDHGPDWATVKKMDFSPERKDLINLAKVYLVRMLSQRDMETFFKGPTKDQRDELVKTGKVKDDVLTVLFSDVTKDELVLFRDVDKDDALKYYLGKKAVSRLGCYGCHDIPGFATAKPIGVALNDWGKKPADRLAFEDIGNFYRKHYFTVDSLTDNEGKPVGAKDEGGIKIEPYEKFYAQSLLGHTADRVGYLNQKLREPRSYDYNRIRAWDDRSRMPKFNFGRPRFKSGEKNEEFQARIFLEEAKAREAVATFVLGLVAEQVPTKSINHPKGDRLAEVKGRQVLEKYNCGSCHLIRPGVYDFKVDEKLLKQLNVNTKDTEKGGEYLFLNHHNWAGRNPTGTPRLTAYAVNPKVNEKKGIVTFHLMEALRFNATDKDVKSLPSGFTIDVSLEAMASPSAPITTQAEFDQAFHAVEPYGGTFTNLMAPWLAKKVPETYKDDVARSSLPPSLIGQGERTQPDWLYRFLMDPQPVRQMTILRMPKFNLSMEEAKQLVDYFAGVEKQTNPGIGLPYPNEVFPQQAPLDSAYWKSKTAEYVKRLKETAATDEKGKPLKGTRYDQRLKEYGPLWDKLSKETKRDVKDYQKDWEETEAYAADAYRLMLTKDTCIQCHQVGQYGPSNKQTAGPLLANAHQRLRPDWIEHWVDKPSRFVPYPSLMPSYFLSNETKFQTYFAGNGLEQINAVRDVLANYPRISSLPVNRAYVPNLEAEKK